VDPARWTALGSSSARRWPILGGAVAAVVSWMAALLKTWQLEDTTWFASLLALGLLEEPHAVARGDNVPW
jgi:hypothetical protein